MVAARVEKTTGIKSAMDALGRVTKMIEQGHTGVIVTMPILDASRAFRIPADDFRLMAERDQRLGISASGGNVKVELQGSSDERRTIYDFLYKLLQVTPQGHALEVLTAHQLPDELIAQVPGLQEFIQQITVGIDGISEQDLIRLQIFMDGLWSSLKGHSTGLFPPNLVFEALFTG